MKLSIIHSYLVHPDKLKEEQSDIRGAEVPASGRLFDMLSDVFAKSEQECTHDISFDSAEDGAQSNPCRDLVVAYLGKPTLVVGRKIAKRLQSVTTGKSGLGLLFLLCGKNGHQRKIVLSRFPADSAILAEEGEDSLSVQFLEKVFMKSATAYKAALYNGKSSDGDFWDGRAVDKQINSDVLAISNYWIKDFLCSDFRATSAQGTKRLAVALLSASRKASQPEVKQQIVAAAQLATGLDGKSTSIRSFCSKFHFSEDAIQCVKEQLPNEMVFAEQFRFSKEEFASHVAIQSVELSNGAILMAAANEFDKVFERETVSRKTGEVRYSTQGQVVDQRLKKRKQ